MNNLGEVVGYADTYTHYSHAFLYNGSGPLINLGSFGGDNSISIAKAINDQGMVVGYSDSSGAVINTRGFLYTGNGPMQDLGTLGGPDTQAQDINNSGQIVGVSQVPNGTYDGFLYSGNGPMVDLGPYKAILINDPGQVVAVTGTAGSGYLHTYISSGGTGTWVDIGSLGGTETSPFGMNDRGDVVGSSTTSASTELSQAFLYSGGKMTDLGTFGGQSSFATGINDFGLVVGAAYFPGDSVGHGFVYYGSGAIQDLNNHVDPSLGWTIEVADAINDRGQIAAEAYQENGDYHAVLLTPTPEPEPSSLCLLIVAGLGVLARKLRKRSNRMRGFGQLESGLFLWLSRCTTEIRRAMVLSLKRMRTSFIAAFLLCAVMTPAYGSNIQYTITDLGVLDGPSSYAVGMNNLGEVVGRADIYTQYSHAFLYNGSGPLINLGSLAGDYSVSCAQAINDQGMVVGYTDTPGTGNPTHAFVYTANGGMQDLGTLGGAQSYAYGINNSGQIVGIAQTANGTYHGFIYSGNGPMVDLGTYQATLINDGGQVVAYTGSAPYNQTYISSGGTGAWVNIGSLGGTETSPEGMNDRGEIVGLLTISASGEYPSHAFIYSGGIMSDLGTFGGQLSCAYGVNDFGVVVGGADLPGDSYLSSRGFVYYGSGAIQNLNNLVDPSLGWTIEGGVAVNDQGQIAAEAYKEYGDFHAVLLTPTSEPEPSTLCLVIVAVLAFLAMKSKRSLGRIRGLR